MSDPTTQRFEAERKQLVDEIESFYADEPEFDGKDDARWHYVALIDFALAAHGALDESCCHNPDWCACEWCGARRKALALWDQMARKEQGE